MMCVVRTSDKILQQKLTWGESTMLELSGHFLPSTAAHCQHWMPDTAAGASAATNNVTIAVNLALNIVLIVRQLFYAVLPTLW